MALTNPYPHKLNSAARHIGDKLQCDIDPSDKSMLMALRPAKGTIQLIVNNLLFNLCNDLRKLKVTEWRPDGDAILEILTRGRKLELSQFSETLERCTSISTVDAVSSGLFVDRGRTEVRKTTPITKIESTNSSSGATKRKQRDRKGSQTAKVEPNFQDGSENR